MIVNISTQVRSNPVWENFNYLKLAFQNFTISVSALRAHDSVPISDFENDIQAVQSGFRELLLSKIPTHELSVIRQISIENILTTTYPSQGYRIRIVFYALNIFHLDFHFDNSFALTCFTDPEESLVPTRLSTTQIVRSTSKKVHFNPQIQVKNFNPESQLNVFYNHRGQMPTPAQTSRRRVIYNPQPPLNAPTHNPQYFDQLYPEVVRQDYLD